MLKGGCPLRIERSNVQICYRSFPFKLGCILSGDLLQEEVYVVDRTLRVQALTLIYDLLNLLPKLLQRLPTVHKILHSVDAVEFNYAAGAQRIGAWVCQALEL